MKKYIITGVMLTLTLGMYAQVKPGVGIGTKKPDASAILEIKDDNRGVLMPRISLANVVEFQLAGGTGVDGMILYNTNDSTVGGSGVGYYYWTGGATGKWEKVTDQSTITKIEGDIDNIKNEISNITGGGSADLSYLVRFRPAGTPVDGTPSTKDAMFYLIKDGANPDGSDKYREVEINNDFIALLETKTMAGARSVTTDGVLDPVDYIITAPTDAKKGEVYFEYISEDETYYMNVTSAIIESVTNNTILKDSLTTIIKNVGGSVFYGPVVDGGESVLYELLPNGDKQIIDISNTISEKIIEILTNTETKDRITELIKESTRVIVETGKDVETGEVIGGKPVFKGMGLVLVEGDYDAEFKEALVVKPHVYIPGVKGTDGVYTPAKLEAVANPVIGRIVSVKVLDKNGSIVVTTATSNDIVLTGNSFKFAFGVGTMYSPIAGGEYDVIFEYTLEN